MNRVRLDKFARETWRKFDANDLEPLKQAILRAALTDSSQKLAAYRVLADTAWATVVDLRDYASMDLRKGITEQEVRLERRGSSWARVSSQSVVIRLRTGDTADAGFKLVPAPPRP